MNELPKEAAAEVRSDATDVYNASLQKLVLWGISREQLERMEREYDRTGTVPTHLVVTSPISGIVIKKDIFEGAYVQAGDKPYTIADLGTLWLKAKIYEEDVPLVHVGQSVNVTVEAFADEVFKGTVTFRAFQLDTQTRTLDARIEVKNGDLRLRPGMFADASVEVPVAAGRAAATQAATAPASEMERARAYANALVPYLKAQTLLAQDKAEGVSESLHEMLAKLEPVSGQAQIESGYKRLTEAVHRTMGQNLEGLRDSFKEISAAMIDVGKAAKVPQDGPTVRVFRCPMKKANWLQEGSATANPYYGSRMLDCGAAVETLPRVQVESVPAVQAEAADGRVLAIPRSAVIDTGRRKVVFVESAKGVYDMRAVKVGLLAGDYYPVVSGLEEGERVVTAGAFLLDAENRLNPGMGMQP